MAKKTQKRKIVRLVSATSGAVYYTKRRGDGEKLVLKKFNNHSRQVEEYTESSKSLGRNEVKKRK